MDQTNRESAVASKVTRRGSVSLSGANSYRHSERLAYLFIDGQVRLCRHFQGREDDVRNLTLQGPSVGPARDHQLDRTSRREGDCISTREHVVLNRTSAR